MVKIWFFLCFRWIFRIPSFVSRIVWRLQSKMHSSDIIVATMFTCRKYRTNTHPAISLSGITTWCQQQTTFTGLFMIHQKSTFKIFILNVKNFKESELTFKLIRTMVFDHILDKMLISLFFIVAMATSKQFISDKTCPWT